jgi:hypothetical protein
MAVAACDAIRGFPPCLSPPQPCRDFRWAANSKKRAGMRFRSAASSRQSFSALFESWKSWEILRFPGGRGPFAVLCLPESRAPALCRPLRGACITPPLKPAAWRLRWQATDTHPDGAIRAGSRWPRGRGVACRRPPQGRLQRRRLGR